MDKIKYIEILKANLLSFYLNVKGTVTRPGSLLFQQDNAKPHTAEATISWLKENKIYGCDWPPYSPDLNLIENLWGIIQDKLYSCNERLRTSEEVWAEIQKIWWNDLSPYVVKMYKSMPYRIEEVIERGGYPLDC